MISVLCFCNLCIPDSSYDGKTNIIQCLHHKQDTQTKQQCSPYDHQIGLPCEHMTSLLKLFFCCILLFVCSVDTVLKFTISQLGEYNKPDDKRQTLN